MYQTDISSIVELKPLFESLTQKKSSYCTTKEGNFHSSEKRYARKLFEKNSIQSNDTSDITFSTKIELLYTTKLKSNQKILLEMD